MIVEFKLDDEYCMSLETIREFLTRYHYNPPFMASFGLNCMIKINDNKDMGITLHNLPHFYRTIIKIKTDGIGLILYTLMPQGHLWSSWRKKIGKERIDLQFNPRLDHNFSL